MSADSLKSNAFAWANPQLKERIDREPHAVLADRGLNVPPEVPLNIVHEFINIAYLLWVDGQVLPIDQFRIDPADEGLLFGRGVWESSRTIGSIPWMWNWHLDRMTRTAELLSIRLDPKRLPSLEAVRDFVRSLTNQDVLVRLNLTAGAPGKQGMIWMSLSAMPMPQPELRLKSMRNPVQKGQAYLSLKTFQYATRLRLGQAAAAAGFDTTLMIDDAGNIQEAAHANLFVRFADGWATPTADGGFLPGTVRQLLLQEAPVKIREMVIPLARANDIREAFATNSNVGIVPVTQIDDVKLPVGDETKMLMHWLEPPQPPGIQYRFKPTAGACLVEPTPVSRNGDMSSELLVWEKPFIEVPWWPMPACFSESISTRSFR